MQESPQRAFLYIFSPSEHDSELYFSENPLVWAPGNLLCLIVQHCSFPSFLSMKKKEHAWGASDQCSVPHFRPFSMYSARATFSIGVRQ